MKRFELGDKIMVRRDLQIGKMYYSKDGKGDTFTYQMSEYLGREGRIIEITDVGYRIDIDPLHRYTEEMLEEPYDVLAREEYTFNAEVERVIIQSKFIYYKRQIDEALDNRMFETNPIEFKNLIEEYKKFFNMNKYVLYK